MVKEKIKPSQENYEQVTSLKDLILFNDEVNTFDFVIETLIEVCDHDPYQAEQCALIAHFTGKCPVKSGSFDELKPYYDELISRELTVSIG